jgi:hypothetical protein
MSDPTRIVEIGEIVDEAGGDASAVERELLRAGKRQGLASHDKDQIWLGLTAQLGGPVAPDGHGAGAAASAAAKTAAKTAAGTKALTVAAAIKGTILVAALGGGAVVGYQRLGRDGRPPQLVPAPAAAVEPHVAPVSPSIAPSSPTSPREVRARRLSDVEAAGRRPATSQLAAEGRVVLDARQALREGRPEEALRRLEAARATFADGALTQEREALTIEALARTGQRDAARARAAAFLRAHPESPHAATVRSYAAP